MEGIFTVGEVDTTRQQRIDEVIAQAGKLDAKIVTDDARVNEAGQNVDKELKRAKQKIWKAYELVVLNVSLVPIPC